MVQLLLTRSTIILSLVTVVLFPTLSFADDKRIKEHQKIETIQNLYQRYKQKFPKVTDFTADSALSLAAQQQIIFIDIRKPAEQAVSMIPGAITQKALQENPSLIEGKTAVAYCTVGYRSGVFAEKMANQGLDIANLAGGILAWLHAGGKVKDMQGETHRVHVYGNAWDIAPHGYETVKFGLLEQIFK